MENLIKDHHLNLGEFYATRGIGAANEDWWDLILDTNTGELLVWHSWSHKVGRTDFKSGEALIPIRDLGPGNPEFQRAIEYIRKGLISDKTDE